MQFFHSIRTRLTVWYAFWLVLALVASGATAYILTREALVQNLDRSLRSEVTWLSEFIEPKARRVRLRRAAIIELRAIRQIASTDTTAGVDSSDVEREEIDAIWRAIYRHTLLSPRRHDILILDRNGDILYRSQETSQEGHQNPPTDEDVPYKRIRIVTVKDTTGAELRLALMQNDYVKIFVAYPLETVNEVLDSMFFSARFYAPLAFLIAVVGGWMLAHTSLRPVDNITRAVREITAENLSRRLPPTRAADELGRLTDQFNDMISRLQGSFDRIQQFSIDASHELRTPLTIMRGEIEVALRDDSVPKETRALFSSLHEEIIRLSSIVENLTSLAGSDMGRYSFSRSRVDMGSLVEQIHSDACVLAKNKNIDVLMGKKERVFVSGDAQRLRQLFLNLVDNAVKYTPNGGRIGLSLQRQNGNVLVRVTDSGIGIPDDERSHIFDRYFRGRQSSVSVASGTGLGLSIAKWIAEAHNGSITSDKNEPSGTVISVTLPLET